MTSKVISIWAGMPSVVRTSIVAIFGSVATILGIKAQEMMKPKEEYWDEKSISVVIQGAVEKAIDTRLGKFEAGWDAFVERQPKDDQLAIYRAQERYEKRKNNK